MVASARFDSGRTESREWDGPAPTTLMNSQGPFSPGRVPSSAGYPGFHGLRWRGQSPRDKQLSEVGPRDICHRISAVVRPASRAQAEDDFAESFRRRSRPRWEPSPFSTRQECRVLCRRYLLLGGPAQRAGGHQHDPRLRESPRALFWGGVSDWRGCKTARPGQRTSR